jgi:hypothetical protein
VSFEIVPVNVAVLWDMILFNLVQAFRGTCCIHHYCCIFTVLFLFFFLNIQCYFLLVGDDVV